MTTLATVLIELMGGALMAALLIGVVIEARTMKRQWVDERRRFTGRRPYDWRIDQ